MNRFVQYLAVFVFTMSGVLVTPAVRAALVDDLQDGRHVLLMRHADAPGIGDPPGYVVSNCATQRNLGDYGKKQAKAIGLWLAKQGIQTARGHVSLCPMPGRRQRLVVKICDAGFLGLQTCWT